LSNVLQRKAAIAAIHAHYASTGDDATRDPLGPNSDSIWLFGAPHMQTIRIKEH